MPGSTTNAAAATLKVFETDRNKVNVNAHADRTQFQAHSGRVENAGANLEFKVKDDSNLQVTVGPSVTRVTYPNQHVETEKKVAVGLKVNF